MSPSSLRRALNPYHCCVCVYSSLGLFSLVFSIPLCRLFGANSTWPDLDMLPLGRIMSHQSPPLRESNLTADEQQLVMTLWSAVGAPLVIGARLPLLPAESSTTLALLTNAEVLSVHNASHTRRPINTTCPAEWQTYAWTSIPDSRPGAAFVSLYDADDASHSVEVNVSHSSIMCP